MQFARERDDQIRGHGADSNPTDRPAVPRERTPPRLDVPWEYPEQQPVRVEIFHSTERPGLTPVFGTAVPPAGLSGALRRYAYRHSENDLRHWLMLLAADRVDVVEGMLSDTRESPRSRRVAAGVVVGGLVAYLLFRPQVRRRQELRQR
jgi:hypothetical protein